MGNPLRDRRTPQDLAASGQVIEISDKLSSFERLAGIVGADLMALDPAKLPPDWRDTPVVGLLRFGFADAQQALPALEGRVEATVDAVCQRCLEPLQQTLTADIRMLFVQGQTDVVDDGFEIWEMEEDRLRPLDLVEEVLIMAMPLITMHVGDAACPEAGSTAETPGKTTRPFADLKSQMEKDN